jgi:DNA-binding CsgD family transcriptional regulator
LSATEAAIKHLEDALALAHTLRSPWWIGIVSTSLAFAHLRASDAARAKAVLVAAQSGQPWPHAFNARRSRQLAGALALVERQPEIALQRAGELLESVPGAPREQAIPSLHRLRGEALLALHRPEEAVGSLNAAMQGANERGQLPLLWRVQVLLGDAYRVLRRDTEAREVYSAARGVITALAETIDDVGLRERFESSAYALLPKERPISPRRATKEAFGGLTTRERHVAALIARGKSNRQISVALFITEGTVATHVGNILGKLGLASRTQVAAWAIERGLPQSD